ncbi:MAG TPA: dephospho-CoA kinase [Acidobacteriaceae bacterium]|nr:dephospho-CoA kinase [Acidobacteriaceae bacterium]
MLRVGLTGGLGSGKSTVARLFARAGVEILEADCIGRELMQPGQPVYQEILRYFGQSPDAPELTLPDGQLNRPALARYVFSTNQLTNLNSIVHPAVIAEQERRMSEIFRKKPGTIVMVESALIFEADRAGTAPGLSHRFHRLILVTAPETLRIARYVARVSGGRMLAPEERTALEEDARQRTRMQIPDADKRAFCHYVIENSGTMEAMEQPVRKILAELKSL